MKLLTQGVAARSPDARVRIGQVHSKVADLGHAIAFYRDALGFELTQRYGRQAAFLSAGGDHHRIGLDTWESQGGSPQPSHATDSLSDTNRTGRCIAASVSQPIPWKLREYIVTRSVG